MSPSSSRRASRGPAPRSDARHPSGASIAHQARGAAARCQSALTIAGLDPSGGAGIAADLRAFAAAGAWGAAACAALTVQSTRGVRAVKAVPSRLVVAQVEELLADLRVCAIKIGALGSAANVRAVSALLARHAVTSPIPVILDPVMIPSRRAPRAGTARLDGNESLGALRRLAARATLITPNLPEARALLGLSSNDSLDPAGAATALLGLGCRAALVKGGHGEGAESVDWLALGGEGKGRLVRIAGPRRETPPLHGTGCTLASLIAGKLAARPGPAAEPTAVELTRAVRWARRRLDAAILAPITAGQGLLLLAP
ncbi:MAG: hydroxymethylpyrimidine/phosphomethylpyrimidine kinase [Byssovorax sp.]